MMFFCWPSFFASCRVFEQIKWDIIILSKLRLEKVTGDTLLVQSHFHSNTCYILLLIYQSTIRWVEKDQTVSLFITSVKLESQPFPESPQADCNKRLISRIPLITFLKVLSTISYIFAT